MIRHGLALAAALLVLAAANAVQARSAGPGIAWVVVGNARDLRWLLARGDTRLLALRAGGHLAQLHVASAREWPGPALWLPPGLALPACG